MNMTTSTPTTPSANELLKSLCQRGVKLWVDGETLRFQSPRGGLRSDELAQLRTHRAEVLQLVRRMGLSVEPPLQRRSPERHVPLATSQSRWLNTNRERIGGMNERLCSAAIRIIGSLNVNALGRSLEALVLRHDSLRTRVVTDRGAHRQEIDPHPWPGLEVIDVSKTSSANLEEEAAMLARRIISTQIDVSLGPLFAPALLALSPREHILILALDRLITDGVSNAILIEEMWALYRHAAHGEPFHLPTPRFQFADYAIWQQLSYDAWQRNHEAYWRGRLAAAPSARIPRDVVGDTIRSADYAVHNISLGSTLSSKLRALARRERILLALVVLSVYVVVMSRWCNQRDIVVRFSSNGRHHPDLQRVVGFFASHLHLRIEISNDDTFLTLLRRVNLEFRAAYEHQDFDRVPDLIPEFDTEICFNWSPTSPMSNWVLTNWTRASLSVQVDPNGTLQVQPYPVRSSWPSTFLPVVCDTGDEICVTLAYRSDLFGPDTISRFVRRLLISADELAEHSLGILRSISHEDHHPLA